MKENEKEPSLIERLEAYERTPQYKVKQREAVINFFGKTCLVLLVFYVVLPISIGLLWGVNEYLGLALFLAFIGYFIYMAVVSDNGQEFGPP